MDSVREVTWTDAVARAQGLGVCDFNICGPTARISIFVLIDLSIPRPGYICMLLDMFDDVEAVKNASGNGRRGRRLSADCHRTSGHSWKRRRWVFAADGSWV